MKNSEDLHYTDNGLTGSVKPLMNELKNAAGYLPLTVKHQAGNQRITVYINGMENKKH